MEKNIFEELYEINVADKVEDKNGLKYLSWAYAWAEVKKRDPQANYKIVMFDNKPYIYDEILGYMVCTETTIFGLTHQMWLPVMDNANKTMLNEEYTYQVKEYANGKATGNYIDKKVEKASMFDINKTLMRCLVKNIAMFGLGLALYTGEDLPEEEITKEYAENYILTFGKHAGKKLSEVITIDTWYKNYLLKGNDEKIKKCIELLTGEKPSTEEEDEEALKLIDELSKLCDENGVDRETMYKHYGVKSNNEMTIEQLKNAIERIKKANKVA